MIGGNIIGTLVQRILTSTYILFSMVVTSAAFGVAATIGSFYLLVLASLIFIILKHEKIYVSTIEVVLALIFCSLIFSSLVNPESLTGIAFIFSEYHFLLAVPIVYCALSLAKLDKLIWMVPCVGLVLNAAGIFLFFLLDVVELDVGWIFGVANKIKPPFAPQFHQVYLMLMALIFVLLAFHYLPKENRSMSKILALGIAGLVSVGYPIFVLESGLARLIMIMVWCVIVWMAWPRISIRLRFITAFPAVGAVFLATPEFQELSVHLTEILAGSYWPASGLYQRISAWFLLNEFDLTQWIFGLGGGRFNSMWVDWIEAGYLIGVPAADKNLHSWLLTLLAHSGILPIILFGFLVFFALKNREFTNFCFDSSRIMFAIALISSALFNDILTDIRERYVFCLIVILFGCSYRVAFCMERD